MTWSESLTEDIADEFARLAAVPTFRGLRIAPAGWRDRQTDDERAQELARRRAQYAAMTPEQRAMRRSKAEREQYMRDRHHRRREEGMIVKVQIQGDHALIANEDKSVSMTTAVSAPLLARMRGRSKAFFDATASRGGGSKDWGDGVGEVAYRNPGVTLDLGEDVADQAW